MYYMATIQHTCKSLSTCAPYSTHVRASLHVRHMAHMQDYPFVIKREVGITTSYQSKNQIEQNYIVYVEAIQRKRIVLHTQREDLNPQTLPHKPQRLPFNQYSQCIQIVCVVLLKLALNSVSLVHHIAHMQEPLCMCATWPTCKTNPLL